MPWARKNVLDVTMKLNNNQFVTDLYTNLHIATNTFIIILVTQNT